MAAEERDVDASVISHVFQGYGSAPSMHEQISLKCDDDDWCAGSSMLHMIEDAAVSGRSTCLVCLENILFAEKVENVVLSISSEKMWG